MALNLRPSEDGFLAWARGHGFNAIVLPDNSVYVTWAYEISLEIVNPHLVQATTTIYTLAVYNLGGSNLINYAPDQPGQTFFTDLRSSFNSDKFVPGIVASSSDVGTSTSLVNPDFMKEMTLANLQYLKDPFGRRYLAIAQEFGPLWGLS